MTALFKFGMRAVQSSAQTKKRMARSLGNALKHILKYTRAPSVLLLSALFLVGCAALPESSSTKTEPPSATASLETEPTAAKEKAVVTAAPAAAPKSEPPADTPADNSNRVVRTDVPPPSTPLPPYPLTQRQVHPEVVAAQHRRIFPEPKRRNPRPSIAQPMRTQLMPQGSGSAQLSLPGVLSACHGGCLDLQGWLERLDFMCRFYQWS